MRTFPNINIFHPSPLCVNDRTFVIPLKNELGQGFRSIFGCILTLLLSFAETTQAETRKYSSALATAVLPTAILAPAHVVEHHLAQPTVSPSSFLICGARPNGCGYRRG